MNKPPLSREPDLTEFSYIDPLEREIHLCLGSDGLKEVAISIFREPYRIAGSSLRIGLLGDLHGHITRGLERLANWERFSSDKLDAILQVGDFGVYDDHTVLDQTTLEISEKDPDELGFGNYFRHSEEADRFFGETGLFSSVPLYFCLGNHDDPEVVISTNTPCYYQNIVFIPNGETVQVCRANNSITIGALGHGYTAGNIRNLSGLCLDILLTHYPPKSSINPDGDERTGSYVRDCSPNHTFFGHVHSGVFEMTLQSSNLYGLNQVSNIQKKSIGSAGVLYASHDKTSQFLYLPDSM